MPEAELTLTSFTRGRAQEIGLRMRSTGSRFWLAPNTGASNATGLSVRASSLRFAAGAFGADNAFEAVNAYAAFWTTTANTGTTQFRRVIHVTESGVNRNAVDKRFGLAIRCVRPFDPLIDTSIDTPSAEGARQIHLHQNFPNPFNPSTVIRFELPVESRAVVSVYDILGREIAVLTDAIWPAGAHSVRFDGSDLASGIYLYSLQAGGSTLTRRFTLLK
jgi:hypothetical protein